MPIAARRTSPTRASALVLLLGIAPFTASCGVEPGAKDKSDQSASPARPRPIEDEGRAFFEGLNDLAARNADDCDRFGAELEKYLEEHQATFAEILKHSEELSPSERKAFEQATGGDVKDGPMDKAMERCAANKSVEPARAIMRRVMKSALPSASAPPEENAATRSKDENRR